MGNSNLISFEISNSLGTASRIIHIPRSFITLPDAKTIGNILCPACKTGYLKPFLMESLNGDGIKLFEFDCERCKVIFTGQCSNHL